MDEELQTPKKENDWLKRENQRAIKSLEKLKEDLASAEQQKYDLINQIEKQKSMPDITPEHEQKLKQLELDMSSMVAEKQKTI